MLMLKVGFKGPILCFFWFYMPFSVLSKCPVEVYLMEEICSGSVSSPVEPCVMMKDCPEKHVSFYIQSGAGPSVEPKICIQNKLVLGSQLKNTGYGVNMVILNEKQPLIDLLKTLEKGSVVLIASYDNIASRLDDEARELIAELGSSSVLSLNTRDSWVFVGGKGAASDKKNNTYDNWPELVDLKGCIPDFLE
uniref:ILEI/PANDER domain-containing protein n=1 Tax=Labrus bergylta TaxID=56723 RepID=A0A3Q3EEC2_9LABR